MGGDNTVQGHDTAQRSPRYNLESITAKLEGKPCAIVNVSPTGLLLECSGELLERGDVVTINLTVPLMDHIVPLDVDGFVIRNDERGIAVDYARPAITWPHVLRILDDKEHGKDA